MPDLYYKFNKKINRRLPRNEGDFDSPVLRENWLSRDGKLTEPQGIDTAVSGLSDIPTWSGRYYTVESGAISPKTFCYTQDGKLWVTDDSNGTATEIKSGLNTNAYPIHVIIKSQTQSKLYLVDGKDLYVYDGNNDNTFNKVTITDTDGNSIYPIDLMEHRDRLWLISNTFMYVSKNLDFEVFSDATDSIQLIVGSGKGLNLSIRKNTEKLYIFNTEGIYGIVGDIISAVASTFSIELIEEKKIIAGRSAKNVENQIVYLADDLNIWSFNGSFSKILSYEEKLEDFINPNRVALDKAVATYYNYYYMLSFVETGETDNKLEIWWDAFEDKIEFVRGRNVSCYLEIDTTRENKYQQLCQSDDNKIMWADRGYNFDGQAIVSRLISRDITPKKGENVRFTNFYPEFEPIGDKNIDIIYMLDGRLSDLTYNAIFQQNLQGETKTVGALHIKNQSQVMGSVRPKINYAMGSSICFYIQERTLNFQCALIGMGIDFVYKGKKSNRKTGG